MKFITLDMTRMANYLTTTLAEPEHLPTEGTMNASLKGEYEWEKKCSICDFTTTQLTKIQRHVAIEHYGATDVSTFWLKLGSVRRSPSFIEDPDSVKDRYEWFYDGKPVFSAFKKML